MSTLSERILRKSLATSILWVFIIYYLEQLGKLAYRIKKYRQLEYIYMNLQMSDYLKKKQFLEWYRNAILSNGKSWINVLSCTLGENYLGYMTERYLSNAIYIKGTDKKYGNGASKFIGEALKFYLKIVSHEFKVLSLASVTVNRTISK